jgi:hypothetical protein
MVEYLTTLLFGKFIDDDEQVDIAVLPSIAARPRAEQCDLSQSLTEPRMQRLSKTFDGFHHLRSGPHRLHEAECSAGRVRPRACGRPKGATPAVVHGRRAVGEGERGSRRPVRSHSALHSPPALTETPAAWAVQLLL